MTRFLVVLSGIGLMASAVVAAQPVSGPYVAGAGGINFRAPQTVTAERPAAPASQGTATNVPSSIDPVGSGSAGYGLGNGWRVEVEGSRRR
jgi:OOP family OmpA-OmpF porin